MARFKNGNLILEDEKSVVSDNVSLLRQSRNIIINGDFNIWQRGISFSAAASGQYSADRFVTYKSGSMVYGLARNTDVPTIAESDHQSNYSHRLTVTTADASIAAGDYTLFRQVIEGYNIAPVVGKTCVLSFWVKATVTGTYCVAFNNSAQDRSFIREYTVLASNTWEKKYVTVPMTETGGTWDYTNGIGLNITWSVACGSTFQTTADAWQAGNYLATSNQVNGVGSVSDIFAISQVQFEVGSTTSEFEVRNIEKELSLCKRYFEKSVYMDDILGSGTILCSVMLHQIEDSLTRLTGHHKGSFSVEKRTDPTVTIYDRNGNSSQVNKYNDSATTRTVSSLRNISRLVPVTRLDVSSDITDGNYYECNWEADAEL